MKGNRTMFEIMAIIGGCTVLLLIISLVEEIGKNDITERSADEERNGGKGNGGSQK